ncbi:Pr6Pr family membrane protein [Mucilaginibacter celer]|uniref:Integral membrane protein n=1 Tax=Mucilaginibacter celer TaxID=2305508 RepID=A0A494VQU2_9SPHI|nr:Pr6Pr family membrane protein [Mucilaginibacter celer]AYL96361.1 hypothetical protein HYN43_014120 [Mucilaginibacter celer]
MSKQELNNITFRLKPLLLSSTVIVIWFALILQIAISVPAYLARGRSLSGILVQLFSYFTILSNLLAAISLSTLVLMPRSKWAGYFSRSHVFSGVLLYMIIVGVTYNLVLRGLWHPQGWFRLADELLHSVNPLLIIICWLLYAPKTLLKYTQALNWLWFPFLYSVYIFVRGALCHLYPYPFLDIDKLGAYQVFINAVFMLVAFLVIGLILVWLNRLLLRS